MKNLKALESKTLIKQTQELVCEERRITCELIDHLREIERRILFCELGYGSLFEFTVKHLGLSEGSAQRRISAMRLARDLPEARESLASGSLSLSNAAKLQSVFRAAKKQERSLVVSEKREVLKEITGLSQRECEEKLFELLPSAVTQMIQERERIIGKDATEIKLVIGDGLKRKLQRIKELLSHQFPDGRTVDVLEHLADRELERLERKMGIAFNESIRSKEESEIILQRHEFTAAAVRTEKIWSDNPREPNRQAWNQRRAIPAMIRRQIWGRAKGQCEFQRGETRCQSRYQLQIDHRTPKALGGTDLPGNLRLLCRQHNVQQAALYFGHTAMKKYVPAMRQ